MKKKLIVGLMLGLMTALTGAIFTGCQFGNTSESVESGNAPTSVECTHENVQETILEATCKTAGQRHAVCLDCEAVLPVETIDPLGHDLKYVETVDANCLAPKIIVYQCQREDCLEYVEETEGEPLGHDWKETARIAADCVNAEKATYTCDRTGCGMTKTETVEGGQGALGHEYEAIESTRKDATCTEAGGVDYKCTRTGCEDGYSDVFPATGHTSDGEKADVTAPNCLEKGYTTYHCSVCNEDYTADYQNALGHHPVASGTVQATCSGVGYDAAICDRDGCDYIERTNIVANTAHAFGADGICTGCGKDALDAFALVCTDKTQFAIIKNGLAYTVYAPAYAVDTKVKMPAELIAALYKEGVYSFTISMGSNEGKEAKSMEIKQASVSLGAVNVTANQMKTIKEFVFADENGIFDAYKDGIEYEVYYRHFDASIDAATGKTMVSSYAISFSYIRQFDIEDSRTYINTGLTYTYDANSEAFTLNNPANLADNHIVVRQEWLAHQKALGYTKVTLKATNAPNQHCTRDLTVSSNGKQLAKQMSNTPVIIDVELTDEICAHDLVLNLYVADGYGTAWNPKEPMDKVVLTVSYFKPMTLETFVAPTDKAKATVDYSESAGWTLTNSQAEGNGFTIMFGAEYLLKQIEAGAVRMKVTFDASCANNFKWFEVIVVTTANTGLNLVRVNNNSAYSGIANEDGSRWLEIDLNNEGYDYSKGIQMVFTNASMTIKSIEFINTPVAKADYFVAKDPAKSSVTYNAENGTWTLTNKQEAGNGYSTIISQALVREQIAAGNKIMRVTFDRNHPQTGWVQVQAIKNASTVQVYGNMATTNKTLPQINGDQYFDIDLTAGYDFNNTAWGIDLVLNNAGATIKNIEFFKEIPEAYWFRPGSNDKTGIAYNAEADLFTLTPNGACNVYMMPDVMAAKVAAGYKQLRVTFQEGPSVLGGWLDVVTWNSEGAVYHYKAGAGASAAPVDEDGNKYFVIDLTQAWYYITGYGLQIAINQTQPVAIKVEFSTEALPTPEPPVEDKYVAEDPSTWVKTEETYTVDGKANTVTVTGITSGTYNVTLRKEWLQAGAAQGYNTLTIKLTAPSTQRTYFALTTISNGTTLDSGKAANINVTSNPYTLNTIKDADLEIKVVTSDYFVSNPAWGATEALNSFIVTVTFGKVYVEGDASTYLDVASTYDATKNAYTIAVESGKSNIFNIRKEALAAWVAEGYTSLSISATNVTGQHATKNLSATSNGAAIGTGSGNTNGGANATGITLNADMAAFDLKCALYLSDNYGTAWNPAQPLSHMVITITLTK